MGGIREILVIALLAAVLAACEVQRKGAEDRAEILVRAMLALPPDRARLEEYSDLQPGESGERLLGDIPTKVALNYLRARQQQGFELHYARVQARLTEPANKLVILEVRSAKAVNEKEEVTRLQVHMKQVEGRDWVVTALQVE